MRNRIFGRMLAALLFAASPASATIVAQLETPADGQNVSGKSLVSGWAYSTLGAPVTITFRVNETDTSDTILCCDPRLDVQTANPGAPLNTGFGRLQNYAIFDPVLLNSIGVKITAGNETMIIDHQVTLAKPGNAEFVTDFILGGNVNIAVDGDEIVIGGAQVNFNGGSATTNLRIKYEIGLQSPEIVEAFNGTNAALFNQVQTIFNSRGCTQPGCHGNTAPVPELGQNLSAGSSWKSIVAVRSAEDPSHPRVSPGDAERSYLYQKVIPDGNIAQGTGRMPLGCGSQQFPCLSQQEIDAIAAWINDGARPPDGGGGMGGGYGGY